MKQVNENKKEFFSNQDIKNMIIPLLLEQLFVMLVGLADTFMVSYAGEAAVSGVSLVNMFNTIFIYLFTALASGGAVVVSQYIGNQNREGSNLAAGQLLMISTVISVGISAVCFLWDRQILSFMFGRVETDVMESCLIYLKISAYSFPALAIYNAGASICRSMGKTNITMYISVISNLINIIGNGIGIFILHAGVAGVAWPSFFARVFSALVITVLCFRKKGVVYYQWKTLLQWNRKMLKRIFKIAVPNGIENGLFQLIKVALSSITALFGTVQIAANGVGQSFWSMAALMGVAMGPAFITIIGQCMGAGDTEAAEYYFHKLLKITYLTSILWNALLLAATPFLLSFFSLSEEAKRLVFILVLIHNVFNAILFPVSGALPNGLRAAGDVKYNMYVSILTAVFGRLVLSVILGVWMNLGVIGIALAMCADWAIKGLFFYRRYRKGIWKNFRVI